MILRTPRTTRTDTLFPYTTLFRSICLRQGKTTRRPRSGGVDRRGQIPEMVSIHVRPPEIEDRLMPGHWEGDLIKGKANARSEEHTSELQSLMRISYAVFCLKKKKIITNLTHSHSTPRHYTNK